MYYAFAPSPIGPILLAGSACALKVMSFADGRRARVPDPGWQHRDEEFTDAASQLAEYFAGERRDFDLPLEPDATAFQGKVLAALRRIPYGETRTYAAIAADIGQPTATRAVGAANGRNPLPIVIPCHRVVGANGDLTGFGGGLPAKRYLLDLERRHTGATPLPIGSRVPTPGACLLPARR